ncbi:MAG TPA: mechanosensitive ion channel [Polyangiaceae bacterium]|nr:mechanosensitive ion channel [Polyangiaceae bacterium]HMR76619.1 mechanosensitive ion channel [Polyangiaceae bacterium]
MNTKRLFDWVGPAWSRFVEALGERLPALGIALLIVAVGFLLAKLAGLFARYLVRWSVKLTPTGRAKRALDHLVREQRIDDLIGRLVFWLGFSIALMEAASTLGLTAVGAFVGQVALFLPRLVVAAVIAAVGVVAGRLAGAGLERTAHSAGLAHGAGLGRLLRIAIVLAAVVVAIDQLGLRTDFLTSGLLVVAASLFGSAALAFGLGARTTVANILASHYVQKLYEVGQYVRVGDSEGRIVRIAATAMIVDTGRERVVIPTELLATTRTAVLTKEA